MHVSYLYLAIGITLVSSAAGVLYAEGCIPERVARLVKWVVKIPPMMFIYCTFLVLPLGLVVIVLDQLAMTAWLPAIEQFAQVYIFPPLVIGAFVSMCAYVSCYLTINGIWPSIKQFVVTKKAKK